MPSAGVGTKRSTSVEFAGRWTLLRKNCSSRREEAHSRRMKVIRASSRRLLHRTAGQTVRSRSKPSPESCASLRSCFRRLLERESLKFSWFELIRVYRRLEARGENSWRLFRRRSQWRTIRFAGSHRPPAFDSQECPQSRVDLPLVALTLDLAGILTPGPRIACVTATACIARRVPVAALEAGNILMLENEKRCRQWRS